MTEKLELTPDMLAQISGGKIQINEDQMDAMRHALETLQRLTDKYGDKINNLLASDADIKSMLNSENFYDYIETGEFERIASLKLSATD